MSAPGRGGSAGERSATSHGWASPLGSLERVRERADEQTGSTGRHPLSWTAQGGPRNATEKPPFVVPTFLPRLAQHRRP